jgi:ribosomal-protein-alanine N-acetyltransferase
MEKMVRIVSLSIRDAIREMWREDLERVLIVERASFAMPWTRAFFEDALGSPISGAFVLESEGRIAAYIVLYSVEDEAHILNIAVDPALRRRGCGRAMLSFVVGRYGVLGVKDYYLEVRESNEAAIGLYRSLGFRLIGRRKRYYSESNEDALVMQLTVAGPWTEGSVAGPVREAVAAHG